MTWASSKICRSVRPNSINRSMGSDKITVHVCDCVNGSRTIKAVKRALENIDCTMMRITRLWQLQLGSVDSISLPRDIHGTRLPLSDTSDKPFLPDDGIPSPRMRQSVEVIYWLPYWYTFEMNPFIPERMDSEPRNDPSELTIWDSPLLKVPDRRELRSCSHLWIADHWILSNQRSEFSSLWGENPHSLVFSGGQDRSRSHILNIPTVCVKTAIPLVLSTIGIENILDGLRFSFDSDILSE
jgi:hypothetical protein